MVRSVEAASAFQCRCDQSRPSFRLAISFFVAGFMLFWIDPSDRHLNLFIRLFFAPPFSESPAPFGLGPALLLAALSLAALAAMG